MQLIVPFQCEICSKRFRYQSDLKNHFESHFRGGRRGRTPGLSPAERPFRDSIPGPKPKQTRPCLYCGRVFGEREVLARHEAAEAIEFEREATKFEEAKRGRVTQSDFEEVPREDIYQVGLKYYLVTLISQLTPPI